MNETDDVPIPDEPNDLPELLTRLFVDEDEEAYRLFARLVHGRIYNHFLGRCKFPQFEAEDLTVSTITKIIIEFSKYKPQAGAKFESWMMTIVRNEAIGWIRSHPARLESLDDSPELAENLPSPNPVPADSLKIDIVREALGQLSADDREILRFRSEDGSPLHAEIAQRLGITDGAARVRFFRAKARLQKVLEQDVRLRLRRSA